MLYVRRTAESAARITRRKVLRWVPRCFELEGAFLCPAVRIRLLEIGEAVKALPDELLATRPAIPWRQIARMRDHLAHRYFDTAHAILQATVDEDLPELERAVGALTDSLSDDDANPGPGSA